jgi:hypothetical protein
MNARPRQPWRRTAAVIAGFLSLAVLSLGTDEALHILKVYPPWGPLYSAGLNALALAYRLVYGVVSGYITAKLAPFAPMHHAVILGLVGFVLSAVGAMVTIPLHLGPAWYPLALVLTALPTAAAGGVLYCKRSRDHRERLTLSCLMNPLLFPYTFRLPECGDFQEPDFAAPSSSGSARLAQSKNPARGF